ncbi:MAG: universal stress protein [Bacillota bacterium]
MLNGKAILATDYSQTAEKLINCLSELTRFGIYEVILFHVVDVEQAKPAAEKIKARHKNKLMRIKYKIAMKGINATVRVHLGNPTQEITRLAEEEDASLILLASHGKGIIKQILLGSTTQNVIRKSSRPVLIEKFKNIEGREAKVACKKKFNRIVIPTDFSSCADKTIARLKKINKPAEEIILVSCIESSENEKRLEKKKAEIEEKLDKVKNELKQKQASKKIISKIIIGSAPEKIIEVAKDHKAGIIMLSTKGTGTIKDLLIGSTADRVARHSPIPVLLFPCLDD